MNHRGDQMSTRFQIATAQYECFQRIMKESHRTSKTIGEEYMSQVVCFSLLLTNIGSFCHVTICVCCQQAQCATQHGMDGCAGMKLKLASQQSRAAQNITMTLILLVNISALLHFCVFNSNNCGHLPYNDNLCLCVLKAKYLACDF